MPQLGSPDQYPLKSSSNETFQIPAYGEIQREVAEAYTNEESLSRDKFGDIGRAVINDVGPQPGKSAEKIANGLDEVHRIGINLEMARKAAKEYGLHSTNITLGHE